MISESDRKPMKVGKYILAWVIVPLILLVVLEAILRLVGFGVSYGPFVEDTTGGIESSRLNTRFFGQFLQETRDDLGLSYTVVPRKKGPNTFRIAVLGGSTALGYPDREFGLWRNLDVLLRARYPDIRIETYCMAWWGMNSHVVRLVARACVDLEIDAFVVYMGHNEFKGALNPALYRVNTRAIPAWLPDALVALHVFLNDTRIVQASRGMFEKVLPARAEGTRWNREMEFDVPYDPRLERVYASFQRNIESICRSAESASADVFLCTLARNLRDVVPCFSEISGDLAEADRRAWEGLYSKGLQALDSEQFEEALEYLEAAKSISDTHADLLFRLGQLYYDKGDYEVARAYLRGARDGDYALITGTSRMNGIVRSVADAFSGHGVQSVDVEGFVESHSPNGIPGCESFFDHVHLNARGSYLAARAIAEDMAAVIQRRLPGFPSSSVPCLGAEDCHGWLAFSLVNQLWENDWTMRALSEPDGRAAKALSHARADIIRDIGRREPDEIVVSACLEALRENERDLFVRRRLVEALGRLGRQDEADEHARILVDQFPFHWYAHGAL